MKFKFLGSLAVLYAFLFQTAFALAVTNGMACSGHQEIIELRIHKSKETLKSLDDQPPENLHRSTGTLIYPGVVLTAAHTLDGISKSPETAAGLKPIWIGDSPKAQAIDYFVHPDYDPKEKINKNDIALILLPEEVLVGKYLKWSDSPLNQGQTFDLEGFGNDDEINRTGNGEKRCGKNAIIAQTDEYIFFSARANKIPFGDHFYSTGMDSGIGFGDSGMPMLINDVVYGVAIGGSLKSQGKDQESRLNNFFARLGADTKNSDFILSTWKKIQDLRQQQSH